MRNRVGIDAAKTVRRAAAAGDRGRAALDRAVGNAPASVDPLVADPRSLQGEVMIGRDVEAWFARLLEAVQLAEGFAPVQAPGTAVNRAVQGSAGGERKSDPRGARTIASLARPLLPRPIPPHGKPRIAHRPRAGRRDLARDRTCRLSRLRGLLRGAHPGSVAALDDTCMGTLARPWRFAMPAGIRRAGRTKIVAHLKKSPHPRGASARADRGPEAATTGLVRGLAAGAPEARAKIARIGADVEPLLASHPHAAPVRPLPGLGAVQTAEFLASLGDMPRFASAGALASAAGLAPVQRQSGKRDG